MADLPLCQYPPCRQPMSLIGEADDHWVFGCYRCGCARVITKPRTRQAAAYSVLMQRRAASATREHAQTRKRFVFLGG